jgi:hypothetical protein
MTKEENLKRWEARGHDTARRGFGPNSPLVLAIGSKEWIAWHAGHARYRRESALNRQREAFASLARRFHRTASQAIDANG